MQLESVRTIVFLGIGGIGMSALARYCHERGKRVSGYDRTPSMITRSLEQRGIAVHYEESLAAIVPDADLVVYTPAIPSSHIELAYYRQHDVPVIKRADLLQIITQDRFTIAVAGTHGKTTTSALIAHLLRQAGIACTAFLGGIARNYESNFISGGDELFVVEADEYDRSFHKLRPAMGVVTSCDPDHLDCYETSEEVVKAYGEFANLIQPDGYLVTKKNLPFLPYVSALQPHTYAVHPPADSFAQSITWTHQTMCFEPVTYGTALGSVCMRYSGLHNIENAVAATAVATLLGIDGAAIKKGLASFQGVKRRFEWIRQTGRTIYIDDYAHHPREIEAFLQAVRAVFPQEPITCIFQPHLYSRTRDFAEPFGRALSLADQVWLLPIYGAREEPIEGVCSEMLVPYITHDRVTVLGKEDVVARLLQDPPKVLTTLGAGDIDQLVEPIAQCIDSYAT